MIRFTFRLIWRVIILLLGLGIAYATAFIIFPYLDRQLPLFFALLVTYIVLAYFGLPALMRTWRIFMRPDHIPLYVTSRDGLPSDPVNIAIVAKSRRHFIRTMKQAGWYVADKPTLRNGIHEAYAIAFNKPYPTAPFSNLFLFNRPQDLGFQIPYGDNRSPRKRHHVRFWQLVEHRSHKGDHGHFRFWSRHFRRFIGLEKTIWVGAAIDDIGSHGFRWANLQLTHKVHDQHHLERDYIIETLQKTDAIEAIDEVKAGRPFRMRGQNFGVSFVSDGRIKVVELTKPHSKSTT